MSSSASWALQRSIYEALVNATGVTMLVGGANIYDDPPQSAVYPFISLGESVARDWSTGTEDGEEHVLTLHVWSRASGKKEALGIVDAIKAVLHGSQLAPTDHTLVNLRHLFSEVRQDPDGDTFHGITRYRAVTEPAEQAQAA